MPNEHLNSNLHAIMTGIRNIEVQPCPMPDCGADDIIVHMRYVGICGSDVHFFTEGRIGKKVIEKPLVLGHEGAGVVVKTGDNVTHLKVGDHVVIEPGFRAANVNSANQANTTYAPTLSLWRHRQTMAA